MDVQTRSFLLFTYFSAARHGSGIKRAQYKHSTLVVKVQPSLLMNNAEYFELIVHLEDVDGDLEQGRTLEFALAMLIEDFYYFPPDQNKVRNIVVITKSLLLSLRYLNAVHPKTLEFFESHLAGITEQEIRAELEPQSFEHFEELLSRLKSKVKSGVAFLE